MTINIKTTKGEITGTVTPEAINIKATDDVQPETVLDLTLPLYSMLFHHALPADEFEGDGGYR